MGDNPWTGEIVGCGCLGRVFPDGTVGLDSASFSLRGGDFAVLAGRNGSGKSLLVRHLLGLMPPQTGEVRFRGKALGKKPGAAVLRELRVAVGLCFQEAEAQIIGSTAIADVRFGPANLRLHRDEVEARARKALESVGLSAKADLPPENLSGGERRRLAIAGLLAMGSECLILDEPFANLDYPSVVQVVGCLRDLRDAGTAILVLTHETEKVLGLANRLVVMDSGRIVRDGAVPGSPEEAAEIFGAHGLANPFRRVLSPKDLAWL